MGEGTLYTMPGTRIAPNRESPFIADAIQRQVEAGVAPLMFPPGYFLVTADGSADTGWGFGAAVITDFRQQHLSALKTSAWNFVVQQVGFFVGAGVSELVAFFLSMELAFRSTACGTVISIDSDCVMRWIMDDKDPMLDGWKNMSLILFVRKRYRQLLLHAGKNRVDLYVVLIPSKTNLAHGPAITAQRWARGRHWLVESSLQGLFPDLDVVLQHLQQVHARAHVETLPRSRVQLSPSATCRLWRDVSETACDGLPGRKGLRLRLMAFGNREESKTDQTSANPSLLYVETLGPGGFQGWVPLRSISP